jgi:hypothetical protein
MKIFGKNCSTNVGTFASHIAQAPALMGFYLIGKSKL